jgi:hypothetical protein
MTAKTIVVIEPRATQVNNGFTLLPHEAQKCVERLTALLKRFRQYFGLDLIMTFAITSFPIPSFKLYFF